MKLTFATLLLLFVALSYGQVNTTILTKKVAVQDSIKIDSVAINPVRFKVTDAQGDLLNTNLYAIDYNTGVITFSEILKRQDSVTIEYTRYPSFLTKAYFKFDESIIVPTNSFSEKLFALEGSNKTSNFTPFDGLNTVGSISRGVTIGNNQNAVVDSQLDLQITGKLSDDVSIRASIQDSNIPTQAGGYSQNLDEFDQIFIELYSDNWNIRAGDVDLQNNESYFAQFTKKVQGISLNGKIESENGKTTRGFAAGALVRGVFTTSTILPQEGNQGPYKLVGPNGELFVLIVSGSERVYVNGLPLMRGENDDYVIDYNAGEIKFNPTYPINATMRITVDYQFTERNYTRFIGYGGGSHSTDTFEIGAYVYSENDARNQPLQQNLNEEQVAILQNAGDDPDQMVAPSAVPDTFSPNKILYRQEIINGTPVFVFSSNPDETLFNVRFTQVGENMGNYRLANTNAINRIYEYVPPVNGILQGDFEPIVRITAPVKLQIGGLHGRYTPNKKTTIGFEVSGSKNDLNLFSDIDDDDNNGFASHLNIKQRLYKSTDSLTIEGYSTVDFVNEDFSNIERQYNVEFNRDWNNLNSIGNQRYVTAGVSATKDSIGQGNYEFQHLGFSNRFTGIRHLANVNFNLNKYRTSTNASFLNSEADTISSTFLRLHHLSTYSLKKSWAGAKISAEDNEVTINTPIAPNDSLTNISQRYQQYEVYTGIGDSTQLFVEARYQYRETDSLQEGILQRVNTSNTYGLKATVIKNKNSKLSLFANYRALKNDFKEDENSLNSRIQYSQNLLENGIQLGTTVESNSGVIPQQEFTYVEVEPGEGFYTWNDYNDNGIQELEEFEVAQFTDQASYVRILLPNQAFLKIRENSFSQTVTLNPKKWVDKEGFLKYVSKLYNQTSFVLSRKVRREENELDFNPFQDGGDAQLGLNSNIRNILYYNRAKQRYTTSYTYLRSANSNLLTIGLQENIVRSHQVNFTHKIKSIWLFNVKGTLGDSESISENFATRNYRLDTYAVNPKISYLLSPQTRFDIFYTAAGQKNVLSTENLMQQKIGTGFSYAKDENASINGEFTYINNEFEGSAFSPVAYQMLEGLQPGTNFTWRLLLQKKITKYLDLNISYNGRDTETARSIHTGSVQLRAYF